MIRIYESSDYCAASINEYSFYYGYEVTACTVHPDEPECEEVYLCDSREWCFEAKKNGKLRLRLTTSDFGPVNNPDSTLEYLTRGVMIFFTKHLQTERQRYNSLIPSIVGDTITETAKAHLEWKPILDRAKGSVMKRVSEQVRQKLYKSDKEERGD